MKIKYAIWIITLFSFEESFSVSSIRSDVIVFISIVFGFYVSTFTYIIFSPLAKKLYATSNRGELTTEFHKIICIRGFKFKVQHPVLGYWRLLKKLHRVS